MSIHVLKKYLRKKLEAVFCWASKKEMETSSTIAF